MRSIRTEIIINASKEQVWQLLTAFSEYKLWNPFIVEVQGEALAGTRLRNTLKSGNKNIVFKPCLLEVEPTRKLTWLGHLFIKGLFDGKHFFEIEELGPNQVKFIHGEEFTGILSNMILNKIGDETRENFVKMNEALKERAEGK